MSLSFGPRRATCVDVIEKLEEVDGYLSDEDLRHFEVLDLVYRSLCGALYNYVPTSGHPGGSVSSGRFVAGILFDSMDYDVSDPDRPEADIVSYAAGHKALGLYAMWALRNELVRVGAPSLLPGDERHQLRLEDLLGFRRNPTTRTPLFVKFRAKPLDGHPTPATPFVRLATGASGVGVASSVGLALGAKDFYGADAPRVHVIEGEGGLTPGRVSEALAAAGTARLDNLVVHVDWNQSSIDSDRVCRDGDVPGDYVQWDPRELFHLHDWNVVESSDGADFRQIVAAQRLALAMDNGQPTAIVYRTVKGWRYGIEGRASHGAGHELCSGGFFDAMAPLLERYSETLPSCCDLANRRCSAGADGAAVIERCLWEALEVVRRVVERETGTVEALAGRLVEARRRLSERRRRPRDEAPDVGSVYEVARTNSGRIPEELVLAPGTQTTLRAALGGVLDVLNRESAGALFVSAADLLGSTSVNKAAGGFPQGYYDARSNPGARVLATGGICEDAMSGILAGLAGYGRHIGVGSSYAAFLAALGHVSVRLHAIGSQARHEVFGDPPNPVILVCAHAGLKTGEDGPTHADPQPLQLVQENFPAGSAITLTPWDPQELWPLMAAALGRRPALVVPFVTRPPETVVDRKARGLAAVTDASKGVYRLRSARGRADGTVVLQGSGVTYAFVDEALPRLEDDGVELDVYYVASAELFDALPRDERDRIFPVARAEEAIGITDFTLPTMYRWIRSPRGRAATLHPFLRRRYTGSGPARAVLAEAGLDGESQYRAISRYVRQQTLA